MRLSNRTPSSTLGLLLGLQLLLGGCSCSDTNGDDDNTPDPPTPAPTFDRGYYLDMAIDSNGVVWLAYQNREWTSLAVASGEGDPVEFTHSDVDGQGEVISGLLTGNYDGGNYATIAIDSADIPHLAHWDRDENRLRYAVKTDDGWTTETIDSSNAGTFASIGIQSGTDPVVSYYASGRLKVAVKTGGAWSTEIVDEGSAGPDDGEGNPIAADVGTWSDLLVASDDSLYVAYYDAANGDLKVAHGVPGNWSVATWASEGDVGQWPSLSEHAGSIYVSYLDVANKDLVYGRWTGTQLNTEVVDDGDFIGADSSITWVGETPVIAYHDGVNNDARLAVGSDSGWSTSTLRGDGALGFYNTIIAGSDGRLNWSCFDHTSTDIVFDRFDLSE